LRINIYKFTRRINEMYKFNIIDKVSLLLIVLTALNIGVTGILNFNLIHMLFGSSLNLFGRIIYIIVGVAGIDMTIFLFRTNKKYNLHK
jgi:uncharacterized protein